MDKKLLAIGIIAILAVASIGIYIATSDSSNNDDRDRGETRTVVDAKGRSVEVPAVIDDGIVTIGSNGPLRFLSSFGVYDKVIEVDRGDVRDAKNGRAYSYAFDYSNLPFHPDNALSAADAERIGNLKPDLVVTNVAIWNNNLVNFEILEKACAIIVINDQEMTFVEENGNLAKYLESIYTILGKALGKEARANEMISNVKSIISDLKSISGTSNDKVYVAGLTINGSNTFNTTFQHYLPFILTGVTNAFVDTSNPTAIRSTVEPERFSTLGIDRIFIDPSSSDKISDTSSQLALENLYGRIKGGEDIRIYITIPIVWDSINYDSMFAAAYCTAYYMFNSLSLEETEAKINGIFEMYYGDAGSEVFKSMKQFFDGKSSAFGVEMPILQEVEITLESGNYRIRTK